VAACSCCNSPWLLDATTPGHYRWNWVEIGGAADGIEWKPDKADGGD
jgi:hypothetical protein